MLKNLLRLIIFVFILFFIGDSLFLKAKMKKRPLLIEEEYYLENKMPLFQLSDDYPTYMPLNCAEHPNICSHIDLFIDANSSYSLVQNYKVPFITEGIRIGVSNTKEKGTIEFSELKIGKEKEESLFQLINKNEQPISVNDLKFEPDIRISRDFTRGERERIKKSLMLVKMVLNSKQYFDLINSPKVFEGIYDFDFEVLKENYKPNLQKDLIFYAEPKAVNHPNIASTGKKVYETLIGLTKDQMTFFIEKGKGSDHRLANSVYSIDGKHKIYLNYNAKVATYGQNKDVLPTILLHQMMHLIFRIKAHNESIIFDYKKKESWDPIYIFCDILFRYVFLNVEFPKIPEKCYRGNSDDIC